MEGTCGYYQPDEIMSVKTIGLIMPAIALQDMSQIRSMTVGFLFISTFMLGGNGTLSHAGETTSSPINDSLTQATILTPTVPLNDVSASQQEAPDTFYTFDTFPNTTTPAVFPTASVLLSRISASQHNETDTSYDIILNTSSTPEKVLTTSIAVTDVSASQLNVTDTLYSYGAQLNKSLQHLTAVNDRNSIVHFLEYRIYSFFVNYFVYITSVPGLLTNPLTIYLAFKIQPQSTSELYMKILGVTDLFNVAMKLIVYQKLQWTDIACKFTFFLTNVTYIYSNWIVVCWTIERIIAVVFPLKLNIWCNVYKIKLALGCLFGLSVVITSPHLVYVVSLNRLSGGKSCSLVDVYFKYFASIENVWYMYLPMLVVVVGNAIIVYKLRLVSQKGESIICNKEMASCRAKEQRRITKLLITVSCAFILLHVPQLISKIYEFIHPDLNILLQNDLKEFLRFNVIRITGYQITDFQNSINFFLYCAFGTKVKKALSQTLFCRTSHTDTPVNASLSETGATAVN